MKARLSYGELTIAAGDIRPYPKVIEVACPECGQKFTLHIPPFEFDAATVTIGPRSVKLPCGWHGYVRNGEWETSPDSVKHGEK
jgi:Family of unknown function (DUF6527)